MISFKTKSTRNLVGALTLALSLAPLTGCSEGAGGGDPGSVDVDVPPIYVAQTLVQKEDGEPAVERNYRQLLTACQDGGMATTPLTDDEVGKLGRTYYQLWFDARRSAWQQDTWDFAAGDTPADGCRFRITHEANKVVRTAQGQLSIDLVAGSAVNEPGEGFMPGGNEGPDDDQLDAGSAQRGFQQLGEATDAGQRCLRWRSPSGDESCTWSEGKRWGFTRSDGSNQATSYDPGIIVLWVHPADGTGGELTTQTMTVGGQPFDDAVFEPPSGVTAKDAP